MIWMYRKDVFEANRDRMQQDLGFDPVPNEGSTWEQFYETAKWITENKPDGIPYGSGHQAKQHDSLMNDFSNVLWAYGGDYFDDGVNVGRFGSDDPGEPRLDSPEAIEAADMYRKLLSVAHPSSTGWDWTGLGEAFQAGQCAMAVEWHEFAGGFETSKLAGKVGYAPLPKGPKRRACMYGGTGIGINGVADANAQKAAWLFVNWATSPETQLANLKSQGRRRDADARLDLRAARGAGGQEPAVGHAERAHHRRRVRGLGAARTSACARRSRPGTSATR